MFNDFVLRSSYRSSVFVGCRDHLTSAALAALSTAIGRFLVGTVVAVGALAAHAESAIVAYVPVRVGWLGLAAPLAWNLLRVAYVGKQHALVAVAGGVPSNGIYMFFCRNLIRCLGYGYSGHNRYSQE